MYSIKHIWLLKRELRRVMPSNFFKKVWNHPRLTGFCPKIGFKKAFSSVCIRLRWTTQCITVIIEPRHNLLSNYFYNMIFFSRAKNKGFRAYLRFLEFFMEAWNDDFTRTTYTWYFVKMATSSYNYQSYKQARNHTSSLLLFLLNFFFWLLHNWKCICVYKYYYNYNI